MTLPEFKKDLFDTLLTALTNEESDLEKALSGFCSSSAAVVFPEGRYGILDSTGSELQLSKCFSVSPNNSDWLFVDIRTGVLGRDVVIKHLTQEEAEGLHLPIGH